MFWRSLGLFTSLYSLTSQLTADADSAIKTRITSLGAVIGTSESPRRDGDTWGFTDDVIVHINRPLQRPLVRLDPEPIASPKIIRPLEVEISSAEAAQTLEIRWQKAANTTYKVSLSSSGPNAAAVSFTVRTPSAYPTPEVPILSKRADHYYFGSLEHSLPYPTGLKMPNSGRIDRRALAALVAQGIQFVRFGPTPREVISDETGVDGKRSFNFSSTDPTIDSLHRAGIEVLYVIDAGGAPKWANPNVVADRRPIFETPSLYAEYCRGVAFHLAERFPTIRRVEIGTNEPNYPENWTNNQAIRDGMPEFADQTGMGLAKYLLSCYSAIKAAAPNLTVVAPGLALGGSSLGFLPFIDAMYRAGCRTGSCWDILSVHSYTWADPSAPANLDFADNISGPGNGAPRFYSYRDVQKRAERDGDGSSPRIMITETGFSSQQTSVLGLPPQLQAYYTSVAFNQYLKDPSIMGVVWADVINHESKPNLFSGIATYDDAMQPKPVFYVLRQFATY